MTGQYYQFDFKEKDKCEVEVGITLNNDNKLTNDEIKELISEMSEELYYSLVNISES